MTDSTAIKTGRRHSASDTAVMKAMKDDTFDFAAKMSDYLKALGFEDEDGDGEVTPGEAAEQMDDDEPAVKGVPFLDPDAHPGAMVCLIVPADIRELLVKAGRKKDAEPDHVTLCYLGSDAGAIAERKNALIRNLAMLAASGPPVEAALGGFARFNASESSDGQDVIVALVDSPDFPPLHAAICEAVGDAGIDPNGDHGFIPHITIAYTPTEQRTPHIAIPRTPVTFDALSLVWAGERIDFPFGGDDEEYEGFEEDEAYPSTPVMGGAVKIADDGETLIAPAIRYGAPDEADMSAFADYFTKATDFWLGQWDRRPMLYHHAMDEGTKDAPVIGTWVKAWADDAGVWLEGQLDKAHKYHAAIKELARRGLLRISTDSAPHLVVRERQANGAHEVKRWPILAASLTVSPAEPRLLPAELKAYLADLGLTIDTPEPEANEPTTHRPDGAKATEDRARLLRARLSLIRIKETS